MSKPTWFDVWRTYQLDHIRRTKDVNLLRGLCDRYDRDLRDFSTMPPADVERICHDEMVHHWQMLRIFFLPKLLKLKRG